MTAAHVPTSRGIKESKETGSQDAVVSVARRSVGGAR